MNRQQMLSALVSAEQSDGFVKTLHRFFGSDFKVSIPFSRAVCDMNIDELHLSVRSRNALKRRHIFTVEQVMDAIAGNELIQIRNLGKKSIREIKTTILDLGFCCLSNEEKSRFFQKTMDLNPGLVDRFVDEGAQDPFSGGSDRWYNIT